MHDPHAPLLNPMQTATLWLSIAALGLETMRMVIILASIELAVAPAI